VLAPAELLPGLWRWTARHPEWRPHGRYGTEVASYALEVDDALVLVDPLVPDGPEQGRDEIVDALDRLAGSRRSIAVMVTIPYHVRSAAAIHERYDGVTVWGHPAIARRLPDGVPLEAVEPGAELFAGATAHPIGRPRRYEMPLLLPSHRALAFGDAVVGVDGGLRVWQDVGGERSERWYRDRFLPTLAPLTELDFERVLVTHGEPVLSRGPAELERALAAEPCDYGH
jgi:hypothetical protein